MSEATALSFGFGSMGSASHIKEVRQTEVAGPIQLRLSAPKGGTSYLLKDLSLEGGFRWGHEGTHAEAERRSVRGAKARGLGLRPFLFYCFFFLAAFFFAAFFLAAITVSYG
jgi:hypothetical protein